MVNAWQLRHTIYCIRNGGVVAYPTESVYGLGCDPYNPDAVDRLLNLKNRPMEKGLILIGSRMEHILPFIEPPSQSQLKKLKASWPGPNTWIIPARPEVPDWLKGSHNSIAVRLSAHPVASALCDAMDQALVSTSANKTGQSPARSALKIRCYFGQELDWILSAPLGNLKNPTVIKDLNSGQVLRS